MKNSQKFNGIIPVLCALVISLFGMQSLAQSQAAADALITTEILASIGLTKTQDLNFGTGTPGSGPMVLSPTNEGRSARFQVKGASNAAFNINLPADGTVYLQNAIGNKIAINHFESLPRISGVLANDGEQFLHVGATRSAISKNASLGMYSGSFTVTITYQ